MADLYATLGVPRDADGASIKKAYLKLARDTHPDKHPDDESAKERFQAIGHAYQVLGDAERRRLYDESGIVDEQGSGSFATMYDFWRDFYERVTLDKIDQLAAEYRGSEEEAADLRAAYTAAKGDMSKVLDRMMHATIDDEPRFRELLSAWIADGSLPQLSAFVSEPETKRRKRAAKAAKEAAEAEALKAKLGLGDGGPDALAAAIVARNQQRAGGRDAFLASLAERFGGEEEEEEARGSSARGGKKRSGGKAKKSAAVPAEDPLDDAAFAAAQAKMLAGAKTKKSAAVPADDPLDDAAFAALQAKMLAGAKERKARAR
jgi:DnaJ family protein C protein 9